MLRGLRCGWKAAPFPNMPCADCSEPCLIRSQRNRRMEKGASWYSRKRPGAKRYSYCTLRAREEPGVQLCTKGTVCNSNKRMREGEGGVVRKPDYVLIPYRRGLQALRRETDASRAGVSYPAAVSTSSRADFRRGFIRGREEIRSRLTRSPRLLSISFCVRSWPGERS